MGSSEAVGTHLAFHYDGKLLKLRTTVISVRPLSSLEHDNRRLFKQAGDDEIDHVIVTKETVFHPQGGGQPSDEGVMTAVEPDAGVAPTIVEIRAVRMDVVNQGQVLHLGRFADADSASKIRPGDTVEQAVDAEKRLLYSRLHTAGHVLGSAVRQLVESEVDGFDELKASHFPDSAACEFRGMIEGKWKRPIQERVSDCVRRAIPVRIEFWAENDFRREGLERLIPDRSLLPPGEDRFRVVRIVGADVYPCGGTHVDTTDLCGETTVKKISRSKGVSRVSYAVA